MKRSRALDASPYDSWAKARGGAERHPSLRDYGMKTAYGQLMTWTTVLDCGSTITRCSFTTA